jgi:hypothetical protein
MKKYILPFLFIALFVSRSLSQVNYSVTNFRNTLTTYQDISVTGTAIAMTDAEAGVSTTPVEIGFSFNFFGSTFTQCMIHADGILKLGTTAPGAATTIAVSPANTHTGVYINSSSSFQNIIMPLFTNLVAGSSTPQYHVLTTGAAPNRVCTIQWKNLRDADNTSGGSQHQYANLEFQVQIFETTNDIAFVYGTWVPSAGAIAAGRRNASAGIKSNTSNFLAMYRGSSLVPYTKVELLDQPRYARSDNAQQPLNKNIVPLPGTTYRFFGRVANDVSVAKLYADSVVAVGKMAAGAIEVLVRNEGTAAATNINVQLQVTGANTHNANTSIAHLAGGAEQLVAFPVFDLPAKGLQNIEVSITQAEDTRPENNSLQWKQLVSQSYTDVYDISRYTTGVGYNGAQGFMALKIFGTGTRKIAQVRIPFTSYRSLVSVRLHEDGGAGSSPSATPIFTSPAFLTTSEQEMVIPIIPAVTVEGDYFIVLNQQSTTNMGWGVGFQTPMRLSRVYNNTGGGWAQQIATTPWQVLARVYQENSTPDIGIEQLINPGCEYSANTEVMVSLRNFSNQPIDFGSTPTTITGFIQNPSGTQFPFTIQKNTGILAAGAAETLTVLTGYDYTPRGLHLFNARTNLAGDAEPGNDSLRFFLNNSIVITSSATGPVCPLTPVTLTGVTNMANPLWQVNNAPTTPGDSPLNISPIETTVVKFMGTDYRGCTLVDSIVVAVSNNNLPPRPTLMFGDTVLSHRNGFKDTVRVNKLAEHTIRWLGGIGTPTADSALIINQIAGLQGAKISAAYVRTSDGCTHPGDTLTYRYATGVLQNENTTLAVCDTSFFDAGGPSGITGSSITRTFLPQTTGSKMRLTLYRLDLSNFAGLTVFDGPNVSSPTIEALSSAQNGNTIREFIASNPDGALTIQFMPSGNTSGGWWAGLTCYTSQVYRTVADGNWITAANWERKTPGGNYIPALRPPLKGDDTVYIRHNVLLSSSQPMDQIIVEEGATLGFENPGVNFISMPCYKVVPQPEFLVKGTLNISPRVQIFGAAAQMHISGRLNNFGKIDLDTVVFNGTAPQTLGNFSGATGLMKILRLDNPAGLTLGSDQSVNGIDFVRGMLNTSSENLLTLLEEGGFTTGARHEAHVNGPVAVSLSNGNGTRLYPIGSNGRYRPVILDNNNSNFEGGNESIIVSVLEGSPPTRSLPSSISKVSELRYYRITRTGTPNGRDFEITLSYLEDDGVTDPDNLTIAKDNGAGAWIDIGGTITGSIPGTIQSNEFENFSDFVLANKTGGSNVLPVTWVAFEATAFNADAHLIWRTAHAQHCANYEVERSLDGLRFTKIGNQICRNSNIEQNYTYVDANPGKGTFYYRLRQVDTDGKFDYSAVRKVSFGTTKKFTIYPNPARDRILIEEIPRNSDIRLLDASGRLVMQTRNAQPFGQLQVGHLPAGIYQLSITTMAGERIIEKVQIVK